MHRLIRTSLPLLALALALSLAACGGDATSSTTVPGDTSDVLVLPPDANAPIDINQPPVDTTRPPDDTTQADTGPAAPGTFTAPCTKNADCESLWCVPTPDGQQCSRRCIEECPDGWQCLGVSPAGDSIEFVCVQKQGLLCTPCVDNKDCNFGQAAQANLCVSYGDEGSFCGLPCAGAGSCPTGFSCGEVTTVSGQTATQCKRDAGVCECNEAAKQLGASTSCVFTNAFGTCSGTRSCTAAGLSACGGEGAAPEVCNGRDDDCNGFADDGIAGEACMVVNDVGSCPGTTTCSGGVSQCVGQTPAAEICNGQDDNCDGSTDEGFPDNDMDGLADCHDPDDDNDGTLDGADCAPFDAAINPNATEVCDGSVDENCSGTVDEAGAQGCLDHLKDADGDSFGSKAAPVLCLCAPDAALGYTIRGSVGDDCDDLVKSTNPGGTEVCNLVDDDCDGSTDEDVLSPCGGCSPVCLFDIGGGGSEGELDPEGDHVQNLVPNPSGGLTLTSGTVGIPFIWIANSAEGTVSKLDTTTGNEVARYNVCSDPSRTAVDLRGDGIITCRGDGRVAKVAIIEADCIDKNNNGAINTSRDIDGNGRISLSEQVANDECVLWTAQPDGIGSGCEAAQGCARAAGVDADNNVWVGFWNSYNLRRLDSTNGTTMSTFTLTGRPYGLAIAADQTVWVASRSPHSIIEVHPETGEVARTNIPDRQIYGMAIDHLGKVWVASGSNAGISRFDPANSAAPWTHFGPWTSRGFARGVATRLELDGNGNVTGSKIFTAHHTWTTLCTGADQKDQHRSITVLDAGTLTETDVFDLGGDVGPVGVAIDVDGQLWTVNQCASTATRLDAMTGAVLGEFPVGTNPYTYSDMTGYALRTITAASGLYRQVFTGWPGATTRWKAIFADAHLPGAGTTYLRLRYRVADSVLGLADATWSAIFGDFPPRDLPLSIDATGFAMEVEASLHTDDNDVKPTLFGISVLAEEE